MLDIVADSDKEMFVHESISFEKIKRSCCLCRYYSNDGIAAGATMARQQLEGVNLPAGAASRAWERLRAAGDRRRQYRFSDWQMWLVPRG